MKLYWLIPLLPLVAPALAQDAGVSEDVRRGHDLAVTICAYCHAVEPAGINTTVLDPPAPPLAQIANRGDMSADALESFLRTTHRDVKEPKGMSNPQLLDVQIKEIAAYVMSLRKAR
jgi:mono/diheme cytochrome c family protein